MYHEYYEEDLKDAKKMLKDYAKQIKHSFKTDEKTKRVGLGILTGHSHFHTNDGVTLEYMGEINSTPTKEIPKSVIDAYEKGLEVTELEPDSGTLN